MNGITTGPAVALRARISVRSNECNLNEYPCIEIVNLNDVHGKLEETDRVSRDTPVRMGES